MKLPKSISKYLQKNCDSKDKNSCTTKINDYIYPQARVSSFPGLISVARVNGYIYEKYQRQVNTCL